MSLNGKLESEYVLSGELNSDHVLSGKLSKLETINGLSAYELAVLHGFNGTEEEWLASLVPDDIKFVPEKAENEAYADAMAYNVASYFCNMIPESTDCVVGNPVRQKTFVPVYNSKESVLYTNLLRYDAVIDNQSTFGHYVPAGTESTQPDTESGADADTETDTETDIDSDPESGAGKQPQRGITQDGNHDVLNVGGTNYPIMYMACSNFLMLLTKNRAYENSPWYKLFTDKDATPRQLAALCLERGDTDKTPWTFDCLNVAISWRIAEVMRSSGCTPFFVTSKSEDGVVTWDTAGVEKMRDGDIMFAGKPQYPNRYKGIYHCMMYFRDLDRINAAAKAWGADVELRGFDEARNMGFSGKYGYVVHCGGGTDESDVAAYDVKIKNVIRIETMERFMANTGKGVTVWGARAAANALNSTKLHQGVTGRMVLYDCVLVSSYRHNTADKENKTISYQYVESMRSGKDRNNGVFSYGQYRYSQLRSPVTTKEIDGKTVKTLNFNDFVGSKKSGTYCVWTDNVNLVNGPTQGNVTEGSSVLANPTVKLFMLEVNCVSISSAYAIQRVSTLTKDNPKVWERTFNYNGEPSDWREIIDATKAKEIAESVGGGQESVSFDSMYYDEENYLHIMLNGVDVVEPVYIAGGGGGSAPSNNAVLTLTNTSGWISKTFSFGSPAPVSFAWSSIEQEMETGAGVLKITVNDVVKKTMQIEQGEHSIDMSEYLSVGDNTVQINIRDKYGNTQTIMFNLNAISLVLNSGFDSKVAYTGEIPFTYTPVAAVEKTVYFKVDGKEIGKATVTDSGRQKTFKIPAQSHGSHSLEVYFTAVIDGETVPSNHLYYEIICLESGNYTPVISTSFRGTEAEQYESVAIPYIVYNPQSLTSDIVLASNETTDTKPLTVDRTEQTWTYRPETVGELLLTITCGNAVKLIKLNITESTMKVAAETNDLALYLTAYGRSNNEENPSEWKSGDMEATLTDFTFVSDGWVKDEDQNTVLRVSGDARVQIPLKIFEQDFRSTGKTIEIEFASRNVLDYDAVLATCWAGDRGFEITAQQAMMKSEQSEVRTPYKEDDHLRLSFVIEKRTENRLIISYINGIISGMVQYPDDDDFSQTDAVGITLGSNDCTIDIYNIRIYDNDLNRFQMLDNWIADTQNIGEKKDRYDRNDIFDQYGAILPTTLRPTQCYLVINCPVLPTYKGDKKTCSGKYVDPVHPERSFTFTNATIDVQGTSSQYYYVKNFKIKFNDGFKMSDGTLESKYAMNSDSIPVDTFTFKADVASSEGANNVVLAELYNDLCTVKTPPQKNDPRVRQCIEGHPIVVFHDDGNGSKFLAKYNFNNDKGTADVFGFKSGDESWEILENGNALVSFKSADFTNWETAFEARYPDKYKNIDRLKSFVAWVASTDTDAVSSEAEKAARLNKFKNELSQWADIEDAIFYYLFTLVFLCIDQREKNAFPTYFANKGKWMWLFYDADSSIGTDNKGNLTFEYWMEDIDYTAAGDPVFNGQNNVFWSNLRRCFADEIRDEYRRLRTTLGADGKPLLSYDKVNELFTAHQSQWSEAIYNEDAWRKAVEPLEKNKDAQYLPMQQGKKEQHFKHWMYNRFRYLDSKFETGAALDEENRIMMRAHAQGNIFLTSYINMYGQVYFNSERAENRMVRDREYEFVWSAQGAEDAVIGVNSAPMITSLGDLSPLMLEYCHIQYAKHLTELKVGDATPGYVNDNFVALTLGNNTLLRKLDVRNCISLTQSVDASGCANIEEVYFDGTSITGLSLPNGGILKKLHLPGTITNLTLRNQPQLSEFILPSYSQITTLRVENVPVVDSWSILHSIPANSRVRLIGFDWTQNSVDDIRTLYDKLDTMRGLDENGNNTDKAQVMGTIHIDSLTGAELAELQSRYPDITVAYNHIVSNLYFYDETGTVLLYTDSCTDGEDGVYGGETVSKESTAQYSYTFAGWSMTPGGTVDANALKNVTSDRSVYAVFTATVRTYTVTWMNGSTVLETDTNVPYGTIPTYNGSEPVKEGEYAFNGWSPAVGAITGDTTYVAQFKSTAMAYIELIGRTISEYSSASLTSVGYGAFYSCTSLSTLILRSDTVCTLTVVANDAFSGTPIISGTGYIYVPLALVDTYKAATNWSDIAAQIRAIEDYPEITGGVS